MCPQELNSACLAAWLLQEAGVPVTNYGLLLAYVHSPAALELAMKPWGLTL